MGEFVEQDDAKLEAALGLPLERIPDLAVALTHRSLSHDTEEPVACNERLEFLGDAILGLVVCEYLYGRFPEWSEGQLAKARALAVSEPILASVARQIGLGRWLRMAKGEEAQGGRDRASILADTFEAVVAALYRSAGLEAVRRFALPLLEPIIREIAENRHIRDYKSLLQERYQERHKVTPTYTILAEDGADHEKIFIAQVRAGRKVLGRGMGRSKKEAEQAAAHEALLKVAPALLLPPSE